MLYKLIYLGIGFIYLGYSLQTGRTEKDSALDIIITTLLYPAFIAGKIGYKIGKRIG